MVCIYSADDKLRFKFLDEHPRGMHIVLCNPFIWLEPQCVVFGVIVLVND